MDARTPVTMGQKVTVRTRLRAYWSLIKSLQTTLLIITGLAGYMSARCPFLSWQVVAAVATTLFLTIGGSTVFNMVYDRDIDALMMRSWQRPLPKGTVRVPEALLLGLALTTAGLGWAFALAPIYGLVVAAGVFFDVVVYTIWLKRRTPYSIILGGLAGGMPALAGRSLAIGAIDGIGLLLALAVLLWIPTHIMTFNIRYQADYQKAGVPTFPEVYGVPATRLVITLSSVGAAVAVTLAALAVGISWGWLGCLMASSTGLLLLAILNVVRPSARLNFSLFKYASLYMLGSMLVMATPL